MSLPPFTVDDIARWFGPHEVAKGRGYVKEVAHLTVMGLRITAQVQGSVRAPYRVIVEFVPGVRVGVVGAVALCSCPVRRNCKHAAATLLAALEQQKGVALTVNPEVVAWLEGWRATEAKGASPRATVSPNAALIYLLERPMLTGDPWRIVVAKTPRKRSGELGPAYKEWTNVEQALLHPPSFVAEDDVAILRMLWGHRTRERFGSGYPLNGPHSGELMPLLLAGQRLAIQQPGQSTPLFLTQGEPRPGHFAWSNAETGHHIPTLTTTPTADDIVSMGPLWYLDLSAKQVGKVTIANPEVVSRLLSIPPLSPPDLPLVAEALAALAPDLPTPAAAELQVIDQPPVPILTLRTVKMRRLSRWRSDGLFDVAIPSFRYGDIEVGAAPGVGQYVMTPEGEMVRVARRPKEEAAWLRGLGKLGLRKQPADPLEDVDPDTTLIYGLELLQEWPHLMANGMPRLELAGWQLRIPTDFRHRIEEVDGWEGEIAEEQPGWFNLNMGIVVGGRRLPLAPLLRTLLQEDRRWLDAVALSQIDDQEVILLDLPGGGRVGLRAERLKPLVRTLIDLFDAPTGPSLRLSRWDASRLAELSRMERWQFKGGKDVQDLAQRLRDSRGVSAVATPEGFGLQLRPYQKEGLAWLQYLSSQSLSGILADDMGLGKTAQTLAHILTEKRSGRLNRPVLVVLPTSLLFNWRREVRRCAPDLTVLTLHGSDRAVKFASIPRHDMVLTTYPLLWRDAEALSAHRYHLLILDEAQTVKNPSSKGAQAVRQIEARHRLCLTGTPLENHLGELWTQFDFLLPGFLGDAKGFTNTFRNPIEKQGDLLRRDLLVRRVAPFILRRRKEEVAKELPPKSVIVRSVELEGRQRDLYETVRSAMDGKVRDAIAAQGFARSQIVILDALLKLRQVCCDPRLLASPEALKVKERAKLDLLMGMLPELVEEGRRILLFSQFTTMLDLIAQELTEQKISFVTLTGQTKDRETVVDRFQNGAVPIFLISLKAGGVGLNLTAADTVIHYDPWWNPAVENQATDRAHRIGQTKRVFVYKLVVAGSIEEKILALQEQKAALVAGILSDDATALGKFGPDDLQGLFDPLPEG